MNRKDLPVLGITGFSHLLVHSQMLIFPSLFIVLQRELNVGLDTLGYMATASLFLFGLGALPAGYFERHFGGRRLILIFQAGSALSAVILWFSNSLVSLTLGLMCLGLFSSIYHPAGLTLISIRVEKLTKGLAVHGIFGSIGLALGPLLTSLFTDFFTWRMTFVSLLVSHLLLIAGTLILVPVRKGQTETDTASNKDNKTNFPGLVSYFAIAALLGLTYTGMTTFLPAHFAAQTKALAGAFSDTLRGGFFTTLVLTAGILGQTIGGHFGAIYNRVKLMFWIVLSNIPLLILTGWFTGLPLIFVGALFGVVHFTVQPIGNALIAQFTSSEQRGLGYGVSFFFSFGIGALAAGLSGWIAVKFSVAAVFPVLAVFLIPGLFLAWWLRKFQTNDPQRP